MPVSESYKAYVVEQLATAGRGSAAVDQELPLRGFSASATPAGSAAAPAPAAGASTPRGSTAGPAPTAAAAPARALPSALARPASSYLATLP